MSWLIRVFKKDARRFRSNDKVRFFTDKRKGTGKNIVITPNFQKGHVVDFQSDSRKYLVNDGTNVHEVHPRNLMPDGFSRTVIKDVSNGDMNAPLQ